MRCISGDRAKEADLLYQAPLVPPQPRNPTIHSSVFNIGQYLPPEKQNKQPNNKKHKHKLLISRVIMMQSTHQKLGTKHHPLYLLDFSLNFIILR